MEMLLAILMEKQDERILSSQEKETKAYIQKEMIMILDCSILQLPRILWYRVQNFCRLILPNILGHRQIVSHNQIDHVLVDKRRQSTIIDMPSLRRANCNTDHYLVVETIRERLSLKKGIKQHLATERYNLKKKLLYHQTRKEYHIDVDSKFSPLEGLKISSVDHN